MKVDALLPEEKVLHAQDAREEVLERRLEEVAVEKEFGEVDVFDRKSPK